ncbi:Taurine catabolism dioxygenase TauD, TfdA [Parelaphostrongylus tenuis]|uniref:Taurine catabolism dioxygenase TauD, TfdA n=1 Tax=Parelaphostrongylus tenuis TaxID=148309 RepID=A0AAD5NA39_PARTN|nr:Taurine catabolism dioxygenase TauD, TfdA [Parelaphostrongylus tenuis]
MLPKSFVAQSPQFIIRSSVHFGYLATKRRRKGRNITKIRHMAMSPLVHTQMVHIFSKHPESRYSIVFMLRSREVTQYWSTVCIGVTQLQKENPEAFRILTGQKIDHHYIEVANRDAELHSISKEKAVIELDSYGNIVQIRFNPYDRAPFRILRKDEDTAYYAVKALQFYHAYTAFSRICHQPENSTTISLRPETVIFIDNFRILHSRTAFTGWRQMCGCYLSRDNLWQKPVH